MCPCSCAGPSLLRRSISRASFHIPRKYSIRLDYPQDLRLQVRAYCTGVSEVHPEPEFLKSTATPMAPRPFLSNPLSRKVQCVAASDVTYLTSVTRKLGVRPQDTRLGFGPSTALVASPSHHRLTAETARPPVGSYTDNLMSYILAPENLTCSYLLREVRESFPLHVNLPVRAQNSAVNKMVNKIAKASEGACAYQAQSSVGKGTVSKGIHRRKRTKQHPKSTPPE